MRPWLVVVAGVIGCGGKTNGGTSTPAPASASDFPAAMARAVCTNVSGCCSRRGFPFKESSCETVLSNAYGQRTDSLSMRYQMSTAQACLDGIAAVVSECNFTSSGTSLAACNELTGSSTKHGMAGEACSMTCEFRNGGSEDCFSSPATSGVAGSGGSGSRPFSNTACYLNEGVFCDATGVCAAQSGLGTACTSNEACKDGVCGQLGTCVARSAAGEPCNIDGSVCEIGLFCDGSKCVARRGAGAVCSDSGECASGECEGGVCTDAGDELLKLACAP